MLHLYIFRQWKKSLFHLNIYFFLLYQLFAYVLNKKTNYFRGAGGEGGGTIVHLSGTPYIEETLLGMTFRISPEAFFQINSLGAEALYNTAIDLAQPLDDTALLDVCCGTGTIGLAFAKVNLLHIFY